MDPRTLIAARPHFREQGGQLYFFLSERVFHSPTPAERATWNKLQEGAVELKDLPDRQVVQSLIEAGLLEAIAPIIADRRRRILVLEPHCDDAALSIGGTMWKLRNDVEFHILTMASRSNYTTAFHLHRNYFNRARITAMRTAEGHLFAQHLGGHYHCADMLEATLRYSDSDWNLDFFNAHEVPIAISNNRRASLATLDAWVSRLREFLSGRSFDELWIPLGAGTHSDHDLARNAALQIISERNPEAVVRLYEDVPYAAQFQEHTDRILNVMRDAGAILTPWFQDVTCEFQQKLVLLSIFASQFKVRSVQSGVERSAGASAGPSRVERLWTLDRLPRKVPEDQMWIGAPDVVKTALQLSRFLEGANSAPRVPIFAISASGRWAVDLQRLSQFFPAAKFIVYASPKVAAEFAAVDDNRVEVHPLNGRWISWLKPALREMTNSHRIIIGGDSMSKAMALMMLWPIGHKIACSDMDHLIQALGR